MKRILPILVVMLLLTACSQSHQTTVDADERVQQYLALFDDAEYSETAFSGSQLTAISDLISQDCGEMEIPEKVIRATYTAKAATLAAYISEGEIICVASKLNQDALAVEKGETGGAGEGVLLTVNGEPITQDDLQLAVNALPEATREQATVGALLNQLVDQELLRQAAADVAVDANEVETAAETAWRGAGFETEDAFKAALEENGGSYDDFLSRIEQDVKVQQLLVEEGITDVNVSEDAAREFYLQNTNAFLVSEQVRFRQLFISFNASGGVEQAQARLQNALTAINDGLDFCAAVQRYSDDAASKERCGEYVAARGVLTPNLESSIFSLDVNQSTVAQSDAGFHVIVMLEKQPSMVIPYQQAASQVEGVLRNQLVQQNLNLYLLNLRANAEIIDYS